MSDEIETRVVELPGGIQMIVHPPEDGRVKAYIGVDQTEKVSVLLLNEASQLRSAIVNFMTEIGGNESVEFQAENGSVIATVEAKE